MSDPRFHLKMGDWNAICDVCGFKFKASELRQRWDGRMVCELDWETRQPQDLIKVPKDDPSVPWTRPRPADEFVDVQYQSPAGATEPAPIPSGTFNTSN